MYIYLPLSPQHLRPSTFFQPLKINLMISTQLLPKFLLGAGLFFLAACNDSGEKTTTEEVTTDTMTSSTTMTNEPLAASTITRTAQGMMIAKHRVGNFAKWMASYEAHDSLRLANGVHNYVIGRGVMDSNMVLVALKTDDFAKAKAFAKDASLKKAMEKGGVTGTPTIIHNNAVFQDTAMIGEAVRSMTTFSVKDWATWEKGFEEGRPERIANGIVDRVYAHDADNPNKVTVVTAVVDSAKAADYWKSDMLKKRRAAGGVIGTPERFLFRVVKRY